MSQTSSVKGNKQILSKLSQICHNNALNSVVVTDFMSLECFLLHEIIAGMTQTTVASHGCLLILLLLPDVRHSVGGELHGGSQQPAWCRQHIQWLHLQVSADSGDLGGFSEERRHRWGHNAHNPGLRFQVQQRKTAERRHTPRLDSSRWKSLTHFLNMTSSFARTHCQA